MPILATGNRLISDRNGEGGFSLVELLAVLAILSLMVGAVVMNLPQPRSETDRASEAMAMQLDRFLDDGAIAGEVRALGPYAGGLALFRHDGLSWVQTDDLPWPNAAQLRLERGGERVDIPELAAPDLLFEPYGSVPDFTLILQDRQASYELQSDPRGRIIRIVDR